MDEGAMASTKLYVGNLFYDLTQEDLEAEFGKFGPLEQCAVKKGYAFVHYERLEDAEMAVQEMNNKELGGRRLRVAFAVSHGMQRRYDGPPPPLHAVPSGPPPVMQQLDPIRPSPLLRNPRFPVNASPNLFVANIPPHVKMSELDDTFARFGEVKNVKVLPQSRPDAPMSAFVDYTDVSSAQKAHSSTIVMSGQQLRTDYNFRKSKGDGLKRVNGKNPDGGYDGEEQRGRRPRHDSIDSQFGKRSKFEDETEDPSHRRHHHHRHSSRHHSSRHSREDPEERERSASPLPYRHHSSSRSLCRGEDSLRRERSRVHPSYVRPDDPDRIHQHARRSHNGEYNDRRPRGEGRVAHEYAEHELNKLPPQEPRRHSRPEISLRHGSRRSHRNDRSWSPSHSRPRSRSR
uniref:RRM domain-containing protein n=1 Tax=Peronospora matthiolae TaxID=2874970 RepID=A0AAV1UYS0_9STRA